MPSGAKKRKAAKRRKEQEQQQQLGGGAHPRGSPTSIATDSSSPPQGNDLKEEDDHDSKGSESGSDVASPTAQLQDHHYHHLGISGADEQSDSRSEDSMKESGSSGSVDVEFTESTVNGGEGNASESSAHQKMEETGESTGEEVVVSIAAADVGNDEVAPLPPSNAVPRTPVEAPISEPGGVSSEHVPSEKGKDVSVLAEVPSPVELKQPEASGAGDLVEQPAHIPIAEEVVRPTDVHVERLEVVDNTAVDSSDESEHKLVPPTDATNEERDPTVESHPGCGSHKATGSSEHLSNETQVVRSVHLQQHRASWLSCCGLFDVIASASN